MMTKPVKVMFICIGNSCRSQIAEALARHLYKDVMEASSAGLAPLGWISELTTQVLEERGVSSDSQFSKGLSREECKKVELIVNMSGRPLKRLFGPMPPRIEDWDVLDPYGEELDVYRRICGDIEGRLAELAARLRKEQAEAKDS